jgi:hypothetical protein
MVKTVWKWKVADPFHGGLVSINWPVFESLLTLFHG